MPKFVKEHHENYLELMEDDSRDDGIDPVEFAKKCMEEGWEQTSHKYRSFAKLPEGMTGVEALAKYNPEQLERLKRQLEFGAAQFFRTFLADKVEGCKLKMSLKQFKAFKELERDKRDLRLFKKETE